MSVVHLCPPLPGHINPMAALAGELAARGRRSILLLPADCDATAPALRIPPGVEIVRLQQTAVTMADRMRHLASPAPPLGVLRIVRDMAATLRALAAELPGLLPRLGCELLVCDEQEPAGGLVARHLGLAHVSLASALPLPSHPGSPPAFLGWPFDTGARAVRRHATARWIGSLLMRSLGREIAARAASWNLPVARRIEDCLSTTLRLSQCVDGFDFPHADPAVVHVGPLRLPPSSDPPRLPAGDGPLVFCSLGTLQGQRTELYRAVARACADQGARLVVAGGSASALQQGNWPGRTLLAGVVDQVAVIAQADLVVCHAGHNTVLDSLAAGVPLVVAPIGFEQPGIAARVTACGVGIAVPPGRTGALARAIGLALSNPRYRIRSAAMAAGVAQAGGRIAAADRIEALIAGTEAATTEPSAGRDGRGDSRSGSR